MSDVFRQEYTPVSDERRAQVLELKKKAQELYDLIEAGPDGREKSVAKTELETAIMWAVKGLTA